jgi:uncharacterized membrane protein YesL
VIAAMRVIWRGIVQFERYGWLYVVMNIVAIALSIPLITAPAAYAGLCHFSHTARTNLTASFSDYWEGFRANLGRGLLVGIANILIFGMLWRNSVYYSNQTGLILVGLRIIWLTIFVIVMSIEFYLWPILEEMERPNLREGIRNALVMTLTNPVFTLLLLTTTLLVVTISIMTILPLFLITYSFIACLSTAAVLDRFERYWVKHSPSSFSG